MKGLLLVAEGEFMHKKTLFKTVLSLILCVLFSVNTFAASYWPNVYTNQDGQTVVEAINDSDGSCALRLYVRGGNVWDATHGRFITTNLKSTDLAAIGNNNGELIILWVDTANDLWRTSANYYSPVKKGPYVSGITNNMITGTISQQQYNYQQNSYQQSQQNYNNQQYYDYGYNYNYGYDGYYDYYSYKNTDEIRVYYSKPGGTETWRYQDGSKSYTYKLKNGTLKYGNYEISDDVEAVGFIEDYLIYIDDENVVYAVEVGDKDEGEEILEDLERMQPDSSTGLIKYIKADGEKYDADDLEDLISDGGGSKSSKNSEYPYVSKSGKKYTYHKSKSTEYVITYDDDEVKYKSTVILNDVKDIAFSDGGYLYMITEDDDLYQLKLGKTSEEKIDSDIDHFKKSSNMAKYVYDNDDEKIDIEDEYE